MLTKIKKSLKISSLMALMLRVKSFKFELMPRPIEQQLLRSQVFLHACKSPITAIKCGVGELRAAKKLGKNAKEILDSLEHSIGELQMLLSAVSNEVNNDSDSTFSLKNVSASVKSMLEWKFPEAKIQVAVDESIYLKGSRLYFEEALRCIASNALESYRTNVEQIICILARKRKRFVQVEIIDLGRGMNLAAKKLAIIGGVSYKEEGSGIGLQFAAITVQKLFGGKIFISSRWGIGTRVTWLIPNSMLADNQNLDVS